MKYKIPFNRPFIVGKELYYITQAVMQEGHLAGDGPFTEKCHQWLEQRLGCAKALLTHSGTAALEMAAILCDIQSALIRRRSICFEHSVIKTDA